MKPLILALLPFAALCAQQEQPPFSLSDGVRVEQNLVYSSPGGRDLHLDLFLLQIGGMSGTKGRPQAQTGGPFAIPLSPQISSLASSFRLLTSEF